MISELEGLGSLNSWTGKIWMACFTSSIAAILHLAMTLGLSIVIWGHL